MERMRQKHQQLCKLVGHADDFLALCHAGIVVFLLTGICINMYILMWLEEVQINFYMIAIYLSWCVCMLLNLGNVCIGGALVNHQVKV